MKPMPFSAASAPDATALCSRAVDGELRAADGSVQPITWALPDEVPVALQINSEPYTVMMATPANLRDFAVGFMIAEGLIARDAAVQGTLVMPVDGGITVDVAVATDVLRTRNMVRRSIEGRTGCGLCGVEDIADAVRPLTPHPSRFEPATDAILRAAKAMPEKQLMNRHNRTVHGAAWISLAGDVLIVREDVGRHTALDKLIGALAHELTAGKTTLNDGFVMMTSRCSFELVQKCVTAGILGLVTVSAPTALAHSLARSTNLFLAALGPGGVVVFKT